MSDACICSKADQLAFKFMHLSKIANIATCTAKEHLIDEIGQRKFDHVKGA
jgi:hypothetical protein